MLCIRGVCKWPRGNKGLRLGEKSQGIKVPISVKIASQVHFAAVCGFLVLYLAVYMYSYCRCLDVLATCTSTAVSSPQKGSLLSILPVWKGVLMFVEQGNWALVHSLCMRYMTHPLSLNSADIAPRIRVQPTIFKHFPVSFPDIPCTRFRVCRVRASHVIIQGQHCAR